MCSKKFNRKWNAQRHNNDLHKGTAYIDYSSKLGITPLNKQPKEIDIILLPQSLKNLTITLKITYVLLLIPLLNYLITFIKKNQVNLLY